MNCQTLRDVIVDLARGEPVGQGSTAAVEAHVEVLRVVRGAPRART